MTALLCISIVINRLAKIDFPTIALFWSWVIFIIDTGSYTNYQSVTNAI